MKRGTDARASTEIDASTGVQYIFVRFRARTGPKKLTEKTSYGSENVTDTILTFFKRYLTIRERIYQEKREKNWTLLKDIDEWENRFKIEDWIIDRMGGNYISFIIGQYTFRSMTLLGKELYLYHFSPRVYFRFICTLKCALQVIKRDGRIGKPNPKWFMGANSHFHRGKRIVSAKSLTRDRYTFLFLLRETKEGRTLFFFTGYFDLC